jgi:hypothetical protein
LYPGVEAASLVPPERAEARAECAECAARREPTKPVAALMGLTRRPEAELAAAWPPRREGRLDERWEAARARVAECGGGGAVAEGAVPRRKRVRSVSVGGPAEAVAEEEEEVEEEAEEVEEEEAGAWAGAALAAAERVGGAEAGGGALGGRKS